MAMPEAVKWQLVNVVGLAVVASIGLWTAYVSHSTHTLVNSRMGELLELTRASALARGEKLGQQRAEDKATADDAKAVTPKKKP